MSILSSVRTFISGFFEQRMNPLQQYLRDRAAGKRTSSKVVINSNTALQIGAVFAAVRIRSGLLATLPLKVYERRQGQRDAEVNSHPLSHVLQGEANSWQVASVFKRQQEFNNCLWGNSYGELVFDNRAEVMSVVPHHPSYVEPVLDTKERGYDGLPALRYKVRDQNGVRVLDRSQMAHVPALGADGITGFSVLTLGAEAFGVAKSGDHTAATFFGNAAKPFLIVETPGELDDGPFQRLKTEINNEYNGDNAFGSLLLEGGATANFPNMPLKDCQFLESRKFQGEEIASRWFGLPPHLAGYLDRAHFDNVEEQDRAFITFTMAPTLTLIEQEWNRKGFTQRDKDRGLYVKFNVDAILRGQQKERYEAHKSAIQTGWKTINEVRRAEDLPPLPGGDILPRPAAIWGKDEPAPTRDELDRLTRDALPPAPITKPDPRLRALLVETLRGLQNAEQIQAERAIRSGDATKVRDWYEQHERRMIDRLSSIEVDAGLILDHCRSHRDALLDIVTEGVAALPGVVESWTDHPTRLADQILENTNAA